jgi:hypothetical protein
MKELPRSKEHGHSHLEEMDAAAGEIVSYLQNLNGKVSPEEAQKVVRGHMQTIQANMIAHCNEKLAQSAERALRAPVSKALIQAYLAAPAG